MDNFIEKSRTIDKNYSRILVQVKETKVTLVRV
jgi:hypothetical protein